MKSINEPDTKSRRMRPPSTTPEGRENQLISLAMDLAEQRLRKGTASSQEVTHFLKLGSPKDRIEKEILEQKKELIQAKTESIKSGKRVEELYINALDAMRTYSGNRSDGDD